ncbi:MAG TPA: molybdopterin cofactor-binding domain-containing protein, partial [Gemmatimonadales bacterium]
MTTRRDFLHAGALGTALVLGVRRSPKGFRVAKPAERFAPSIWIAIDEQGATTLAIGKQEMGQGVRTSLAMILADELDADWSKVELRQASTTPGFSNLNTGGSWSIGGSWRPLREAAAAARAMLVSAA